MATVPHTHSNPLSYVIHRRTAHAQRNRIVKRSESTFVVSSVFLIHSCHGMPYHSTHCTIVMGMDVDTRTSHIYVYIQYSSIIWFWSRRLQRESLAFSWSVDTVTYIHWIYFILICSSRVATIFRFNSVRFNKSIRHEKKYARKMHLGAFYSNNRTAIAHSGVQMDSIATTLLDWIKNESMIFSLRVFVCVCSVRACYLLHVCMYSMPMLRWCFPVYRAIRANVFAALLCLLNVFHPFDLHFADAFECTLQSINQNE